MKMSSLLRISIMWMQAVIVMQKMLRKKHWYSNWVRIQHSNAGLDDMEHDEDDEVAFLSWAEHINKCSFWLRPAEEFIHFIFRHWQIHWHTWSNRKPPPVHHYYLSLFHIRYTELYFSSTQNPMGFPRAGSGRTELIKIWKVHVGSQSTLQVYCTWSNGESPRCSISTCHPAALIWHILTNPCGNFDKSIGTLGPVGNLRAGELLVFVTVPH